MTQPVQLEKLLAGVHELTVKVEENADALKIGKEHADELAKSSRRHRLAITLTCLGLAADLILSIFLIINFRKQECTQSVLQSRQSVNERNFQAEFAKVSGQIKGINALYQDPRAGIAQFKQASQMYLDKITAIHNEQTAHPLGSC